MTGIVLPTSVRHGDPKIDFLGAGVLTAMVTSIVLVTTWGGSQYAWGSPVIVGLAAVAVVLLGVLVVVERRVAEPIVPIHLFRVRTFNISTSASFIVGIALFGTVSFLPLFLQVVNGVSATDSGLLLFPQMLGLLGASIVSGQIITRTGRYKVFPLLGCALAAATMYLLSTMSSSTSQAQVTVYMVMFGVGLGLTMGTLVLSVQNVVRLDELGVATSSVSFFRSTGGAIGVAIFGALFNAMLHNRVGAAVAVGEGSDFTPDVIRDLPPGPRADYIEAFAESLTTVFRLAVPLLLVAVVLVAFLREIPLRSSTQVVTGGDPDSGHVSSFSGPLH